MKRQDLMKFENQIRFGLCEGDCNIDRVKECGNRCPLNNFLDQMLQLADLAALAYAGLGKTSEKRNAVVKFAKDELCKFFEDYSEEDESMVEEASKFFENVIDSCGGTGGIEKVMLPVSFVVFLSKLGLLENGIVTTLKQRSLKYEMNSDFDDETHIIVVEIDDDDENKLRITCQSYLFIIERGMASLKKKKEAKGVKSEI